MATRNIGQRLHWTLHRSQKYAIFYLISNEIIEYFIKILLLSVCKISV